MSTSTKPCGLVVCQLFGGGYCSDFNQFELTVLSSGVRLYISHCVVLHNDPQWRTLSKEHGYKMGEGCSSRRRFILLFLPFTTSEGSRGSLDLNKEVRRILHGLKRDGVRCSKCFIEERKNCEVSLPFAIWLMWVVSCRVSESNKYLTFNLSCLREVSSTFIQNGSQFWNKYPKVTYDITIIFTFTKILQWKVTLTKKKSQKKKQILSIINKCTAIIVVNANYTYLHKCIYCLLRAQATNRTQALEQLHLH